MNIAFIRWVAGLLGVEGPMAALLRAARRPANDPHAYSSCSWRARPRRISRRAVRTSTWSTTRLFPVDGIEVVFQDFAPVPYKQRKVPDFVPNLSVLDALFEVGPDETAAATVLRSAGLDVVGRDGRDCRRDARRTLTVDEHPRRRRQPFAQSLRRTRVERRHPPRSPRRPQAPLRRARRPPRLGLDSERSRSRRSAVRGNTPRASSRRPR